MSDNQLKVLRQRADMTQTDMANRFGLSLRAYQDIESSTSPLRLVYRLAMHNVSLVLALEKGEPMLATHEARAAAIAFYRMLDPSAPAEAAWIGPAIDKHMRDSDA